MLGGFLSSPGTMQKVFPILGFLIFWCFFFIKPGDDSLAFCILGSIWSKPKALLCVEFFISWGVGKRGNIGGFSGTYGRSGFAAFQTITSSAWRAWQPGNGATWELKLKLAETTWIACGYQSSKSPACSLGRRLLPYRATPFSSGLCVASKVLWRPCEPNAFDLLEAT